MAELDPAEGLPNLNSLPANPDAQDTVKDFLDYTEFYPSDLVRSLTLIGKLDKYYDDLSDQIHHLTKTYANLPRIPEHVRPDPQELRRQISSALDRATLCRESSLAEANRLYDVTERHKHRLSIIKRKLQALPEPPSRDPTPPPVSPQAARSRRQEVERGPRITLRMDRQPPSARAARAEKGRGRLLSSELSESDSSDEDVERDRKRKTPLQKGKAPKTPKTRPPGVMGTNVHSSVAGISTSNALAKLTPPPADAPPGSKFAPWFKLTEYEMALLRKQMKKNAIWVPSDVMIRRELARRGRGSENYAKAKAHAEETGEPFLDELPELATAFENGTIAGSGDMASKEGPKIPGKEDTSIINRGMRLNEAKKLKRTRELEEANRQMRETGDFMKTLFSTTRGGQQGERSGPGSSPTTEKKRRELMRSAVKKRKRDDSPEESKSTPKDGIASQSHVQSGTLDDSHESPAPKKLKINPPKPTPVPRPSLSPATSTATAPPAPESATTVKTTTTQVPLAPPGPGEPGTPTAASIVSTPADELSEDMDSAALQSPKEKKKATTAPIQAPSQPPLAPSAPSAQATAAASRPRRESTAPIKEHEKTPDLTMPLRSPAIATAASSRPSRQPSSRPVSRAGTSSVPPSVKAASAEPPSKSEVIANGSVALRRASNASIPMTTTGLTQFGAMDTSSGGRTRRKPAPGAVASDGDGKGKISRVNRRKGQKKRDGVPGSGGSVEGDGEIDANEPRYCVCNDVSYGEMIACDNKNCEGEWFHYGCVGIPEGTLPSRVAKWYCPPCRKTLRVDQHGNPEILNISVDRLKRTSNRV